MIGGLRLLASRWPRGGVAAAHSLAAVTASLGHGIADEQLAAVFPDLSPEVRRAARQRTWAGFLKGEAMEAAITRRSGSTAYPRLVPNIDLRELRPPLILASFHVGPYQGLAAALVELPGEVVALDRGQFAERPEFTIVPAGESQWERARTFHELVNALRAGKFVFINPDAFEAGQFDVSTIEVPMLGRRQRLARGAFALARISRTPIVPLAARWRGTAVEVTIGEPVSPDCGEAEMATATARWIDGYLRERPGEISVFMLDRMEQPADR